MWKSIFRSLTADLKLILHKPLLLFGALSPFILIILLLSLYPLLSDLLKSDAVTNPHGYFEIIAITIVSFISVIIGILNAAIVNMRTAIVKLNVDDSVPSVFRDLFPIKLTACFLVSVFTLLLYIIITDPVLTEGWLRTLFISFLFSFQTIFIFLWLVRFKGNKRGSAIFVCLCIIFLAAVPFGLVFHHPWTYVAFVSPFYWISWAWIVPDRVESLLYGLISFVIATTGIVLLFRKIKKGIQKQ
jgi:hypothetical protein